MLIWDFYLSNKTNTLITRHVPWVAINLKNKETMDCQEFVNNIKQFNNY